MHSFKSSVTHLSYLCQSWLGSLTRFRHLYSQPPARQQFKSSPVTTMHLLSCLWHLLMRSCPHCLKPACLTLCLCSQYTSWTWHVQHIPSLINFFPIKEIGPLKLFPANQHASHCSCFCPIFCPPPCHNVQFQWTSICNPILTWLGWVDTIACLLDMTIAIPTAPKCPIKQSLSLLETWTNLQNKTNNSSVNLMKPLKPRMKPSKLLNSWEQSTINSRGPFKKVSTLFSIYSLLFSFYMWCVSYWLYWFCPLSPQKNYNRERAKLEANPKAWECCYSVSLLATCHP